MNANVILGKIEGNIWAILMLLVLVLAVLSFNLGVI